MRGSQLAARGDPERACELRRGVEIALNDLGLGVLPAALEDVLHRLRQERHAVVAGAGDAAAHVEPVEERPHHGDRVGENGVGGGLVRRIRGPLAQGAICERARRRNACAPQGPCTHCPTAGFSHGKPEQEPSTVSGRSRRHLPFGTGSSFSTSVARIWARMPVSATSGSPLRTWSSTSRCSRVVLLVAVGLMRRVMRR